MQRANVCEEMATCTGLNEEMDACTGLDEETAACTGMDEEMAACTGLDEEMATCTGLDLNCSTSFEIGECFSTYSDLEKRIKLYETSTSVQLTHRDSRTLETARKRVPKRVEGANMKLKYYSIHLSCVFGGKKYKNKGSLSLRPKQWYV